MALQEIKLPRLDTTLQLVGSTNTASTTFALFWNQFADQLEAGINGVIAAQNAADQAAADAAVAQGTADGAVDDAAAANANANGRQPASTSLSALADLSGIGLVEQTGPNAFTDRAIGVAASTSIPTRANADARYVRQDQTAAPSYSSYGGQTISNPPTQGEVQALDNAAAAASSAIAAIISKLQAVDVFS